MNPSDETGILGPQVALLYRNLRLGQIVSILNTAFMVWVGSSYVRIEPLLAWAAVTLIVALLRLSLDSSYRKLDSAQRLEQAPFWRQRAIVGATLGGLAWAGGAVLFMTAGDLNFKLFAAFVMSGMVAGAIQVVAADLTAFRCYAWPIVISVALCAPSFDRMGIAFALMSLIFLVAVTRSAQFFNQALSDSIRLEREQAQLATHLAQAREVAEQSLRTKTQFLSNISHELRTPMNGIIGTAELLALDASDEQRELLGHLRQSSDLLMMQINHLIRLSELEAEDVRLKPAPFVCAELLARTVFNRREAAAAKGIALAVDADTSPETIVGDSECLVETLHHLIDNAIKFTEHGTVSVTARQIRHEDGTTWVEFAVRDTGPGISREALKAIEGLMTQADGSSVRRHGGLGIGLAIVRRLVKLMGGELQIASTLGQGSVFSFAIPFSHPGMDQPNDPELS